MSFSSPCVGLSCDFLAAARKPLIVLIGQTASGKSAMAVALAQALAEKGRRAEIINADSRQFYRGLDIGTGKIQEAEMNGISHHLLSVLDPTEEVSIAWFQKQATDLICRFHERDTVPILAGGSMLYISAITDGLLPLAKADPKLREALLQAYDADRGRMVYQELQKADPDAAKGIPRENKVYVIRALEIIRTSGKPASAARQKDKPAYDILMLGLEISKEEGDRRIEKRIDAMFEQGWVDEVRNLLAAGYSLKDPGMNSIGYKEIAKSLQSGEDPVSVKGEIIRKTKQYAKRQRTWWKGDERVKWFAAG